MKVIKLVNLIKVIKLVNLNSRIMMHAMTVVLVFVLFVHVCVWFRVIRKPLVVVKVTKLPCIVPRLDDKVPVHEFVALCAREAVQSDIKRIEATMIARHERFVDKMDNLMLAAMGAIITIVSGAVVSGIQNWFNKKAV
jgi:hypothetical protein